MLGMDQSDPGYVSSIVLSQMISAYNKESEQLLAFFEANTRLIEVDAEQPPEKIMKVINQNIEPTILHVRPNPDQVDLRDEIVESLITEHGFVNLDL